MANRDRNGPFLTIIIPVYNESRKIAADVRAVRRFLDKRGRKGEIIVVDDGSFDGTAGAALRAVTGRDRVIGYRDHRGKGRAVKTGMAASRGELVLFIDSGRCVPAAHILRGLCLIERKECDIAQASRRLPGSVVLFGQRPLRRISSWLFRKAVMHTFPALAGLTDTQMGLKIYRGDVGRKLFNQCLCDGFLFDVEISLRAVRAKYRIREFPVTWRSDPDTRLSLLRVPLPLIREWFIIQKALPPRRK
jgi:glycosyltransferase involved in cell wall biosynthesis